jgi:hypothetical protein
MSSVSSVMDVKISRIRVNRDRPDRLDMATG